MESINPLSALRPDSGGVPPQSLVDDCAVFSLSSFHKAARSKQIVAIDLDDTLLMNSWTCSGLFESMPFLLVAESIKYEQMHRSLKGLVQKWRGLPEAFQFNPDRYPFVKNPVVHVQFRPGLIGGLLRLQKAGVEFVLVTASAKQRVDFLFSRFPVLNDLFGERVVCAEQMVEVVLEIEQMATDELRRGSALADDLFDASIRGHRLRPRSLAIKTPLLVEMALGMRGFDLLLDDSLTTAGLFEQAGLDEHFLPVSTTACSADHSLRLINSISERFELPANSAEVFPSLREIEGMRLVDPYYFPLLHRHDQFPERTGE